jgi:hypothetical protein
VREIRPLRVMWRELETGPGGISELPRQFPTLPFAPGKGPTLAGHLVEKECFFSRSALDTLTR